jgi:hypothetical protein
MAGLQRLSEDLKQRIVSVLRDHGVIHAAVFGSLATGLATEESDLDIMVELDDGSSLLDLAALKLDLQDAIRRDVDVLTYRSINPRLKEHMLRERVTIL